MLSTLVLVLIFCSSLSAEVINCKGCVPLDSYSFDKIISRFKASIIKFDVAYPYGEKREEFAKVSHATHDIPDLLIGEVGVKDYGEKENSDLADRFKVTKDDFPVVKLFLQGKEDPVTFTDSDFTADNIKKFIRKHSGIHIGLPGCLETFDKVAAKFTETNDKEVKKTILREAEDEWDKIKGKVDQQKAETYVKMMRKALEKGDEFIPNEMKRVQNLAKGKLSKEKKEEMQHRLNILQSFTYDEL